MLLQYVICIVCNNILIYVSKRTCIFCNFLKKENMYSFEFLIDMINKQIYIYKRANYSAERKKVRKQEDNVVFQLLSLIVGKN